MTETKTKGEAPSPESMGKMKAFLAQFKLPPDLCACGEEARGWNDLCWACNEKVKDAAEGTLCPCCGKSYEECGGRGSGTFCVKCSESSDEMSRLMGLGQACPSCGKSVEHSTCLSKLTLPPEWADMPPIGICHGCHTLWTAWGVTLTAEELESVRQNAWDNDPTPEADKIEVGYDLMYIGEGGRTQRVHGNINAMTRKITQTG